MAKGRRCDKPEHVQEKERAKDRCDEEAEDEMFDRESRRKTPYLKRRDEIVYFTSPSAADAAAGELIKRMKKEELDYHYFGFDVEGISSVHLWVHSSIRRSLP